MEETTSMKNEPKFVIKTEVDLASSSNPLDIDDLKVKKELAEDCADCQREQAWKPSIKLDPAEGSGATLNELVSTHNCHSLEFNCLKIKKELCEEHDEEHAGQTSMKFESELIIDPKANLINVKEEQATTDSDELAHVFEKLYETETLSESDDEEIGKPSRLLLSKDSPATTGSLKNYMVRQDSSTKKFVATHEKPVYTCYKCGKRIKQSKKRLRLHIKKGCKPHSCGNCGFRSSQTWSLNRHMKTHTGEKPYACDACKYRTCDSSNFKRHMKRHTGEKPYTCNICDYRTAEQPKLRRHLTKKSHRNSRRMSTTVMC